MEKYIVRIDYSPERLVEAGPLVQGSWSPEHDDLGREIRGEFLIDTGAYGAMIDLAVAEMLALSPRGTRSVHGIHGYGTLQFYLGRVSLAAVDAEGRQSLYSTVLECVGVPSLREKSFEHRADVIGILGRVFLRNASISVDNRSGKLELIIVSDGNRE
jgi:predicted aspartyl protease